MPGSATDNVHEVSFFSPSGNTLIDAIMFGFKYAAEDDDTYEVTYSFPDDDAVFNDSYIIEGQDAIDGFFPVTDQMAGWLRGAADFASDVSNLTLIEVPDNGTEFGEIRLAGTTNLPDHMGAGVFGDADAFHLNRTGDIFFDDRAVDTFSDSFLQRIVVHELGHSLGLAHPGDGFGESVAMPAEYDGDEYTIMDTNFDSAFFEDAVWADTFPSTFMYLDILALQHMYGVNESAGAGNTTYTFDLSEDHFMTLYDLGGKDTIKITGTRGSTEADSVEIDLSTSPDSLGGHFIDVGTTVTYFDQANEIVGTRDKTVYISPETTIENVTAAAGDDVIVGNDLANVLKGGDGDDVISADAGNDTVVGGDGNDVVAGGDGNDAIWAGATDTGDDIASGDAGDDTVAGGSGDDTLAGGTGSDLLLGGDGNDVLVGHGWNEGAATTDETSSNQIWAGSGDDEVHGANGSDLLGGGLDDDTITGAAGDDVIYAGKSGKDQLSGDAGNDLVFGGTDDDTIMGGAGDDELYGGAGADIVHGDADSDTLYGGAGDDTLDGGTGDDIYRAGDGADVLVFSADHGADTVSGFDLGEDTLNLSGTQIDFSDIASVEAAAEETTINGDAGLLIDTGDGNSIFLIGLETTDIASMDFVF